MVHVRCNLESVSIMELLLLLLQETVMYAYVRKIPYRLSFNLNCGFGVRNAYKVD